MGVAVDVGVDVLGDPGGGVAEEHRDVQHGVPMSSAQVAKTCRRLWKVHSQPRFGRRGQPTADAAGSHRLRP